MAQPFDAERLATTGEAIPVAEQVQSVLNSGRVGAFSVSETGLLAYREGAGARGTVLTWFDRSGKQGTTIGDPAPFSEFRFSPDRKSVAAVVSQMRAATISGSTTSRADSQPGLPSTQRAIATPSGRPTGRSIVFRSNRKGKFDLYRKAVDSVGAEELLYADDLDKTPTELVRGRKVVAVSRIRTQFENRLGPMGPAADAGAARGCPETISGVADGV